MDMRKHRRIYKGLPVTVTPAAADEADVEASRAMLKDISLGGISLRCKDRPHLAIGQVLDFSIKTTTAAALEGESEVLEFKGEGRVLRIQEPREDAPYYGVAVEFMEPLDLMKIRRSFKG
jgi:c-di-GMP-binding flagellar brake protein YcgR